MEHRLASFAFIDGLFEVKGHNWLQMLVLCIVRRTPSELLILLVVIVGMLRPRELLRATLTML